VTADGANIDGGVTTGDLTIDNDDTPTLNFKKAASADILGTINVTTDAGSGGKMVFQTKRNGNTALDRMTIDDDGRVGIGTSSPSGNLEIATSAADTGVDLVLDGNKTSNSGIGSIIFNNNGDSVGMIRSNRASADDAADMLFYTQATGGANTQRMAITNAGNVKIGTATDRFSNLTASTANLQIDGGVVFEPGSGNDVEIFNYRTTDMLFGNGATEAMRIDSSGSVGIGTGSPSYKLDVRDSSAALLFAQTDATSGSVMRIRSNAGSTNVLEVTAAGSVGIGTSSPAALLEVQANSNSSEGVRIENNSTGASSVAQLEMRGQGNNFSIKNYGDGTSKANITELISTASLSQILFGTASTEAARLDSSGNLLVGTTDATPASTTGVALGGSSGYVYATRDGNASGLFNRLTSDGDIAQFRKAGTTVGSIGSNGGTNLYLTSGNRGIRFNDNDFSPITSGNAYSDNTTDLGRTTARFKNIYLSNQIIGGFGAQTTSGTTDWNHSTNARSGMGTTLLLGNATNGPGATGYFHAVSFEYTSKDGSGNMTQLAIGYNSNRIFMRYRYSNSWSSWTEI